MNTQIGLRVELRLNLWLVVGKYTSLKYIRTKNLFKGLTIRKFIISKWPSGLPNVLLNIQLEQRHLYFAILIL